MIEKEGKKYIEVDKNAYVISMMSGYELYKILCKELSFNEMIELYSLIDHKIKYLDDVVRMEVSCCKLKDSDINE